ncbi:uncharacterized protein V1513DRAFT_435106 [Lipomyces chichibuensis]|uniref:uncharacterized protein n=1 Tax=Lipomyces chichibuensis TaxID=1546026 RepID=UPI0033442B9F
MSIAMSSQQTNSPSPNPTKDDSPCIPPLYFTIIQDTTTDVAAEIASANATSQTHKLPPRTRTYHPRVHYLFSDDADNPECPSPFAAATGFTGKAGTAGKTGNERAIIVDFAADAKTVLRATSLSPDWQVTNAETSSLAMRSGATGGGIDIGKMLTIEGIGSGNTNHKLVAAMTRQRQGSSRSSSRSGSRQADESQAETELAAALTYADLFAQTNLKLKRLIEQSPPDEYAKIVEKLKAVSLGSTSPSQYGEIASVLNSNGIYKYEERDDNSYGLQSTIMQQSAVGPRRPSSRIAMPGLKDEEEGAASFSGTSSRTSPTPEQATPTENEALDDNNDLDKTIVNAYNEPQRADIVFETLTAVAKPETHPSTDELATTEPPVSSSGVKHESFSSPWAN